MDFFKCDFISGIQLKYYACSGNKTREDRENMAQHS